MDNSLSDGQRHGKLTHWITKFLILDQYPTIRFPDTKDSVRCRKPYGRILNHGADIREVKDEDLPRIGTDRVRKVDRWDKALGNDSPATEHDSFVPYRDRNLRRRFPSMVVRAKKAVLASWVWKDELLDPAKTPLPSIDVPA